MRNPVAALALLPLSVVITSVAAAQTSAPQITITPTAAQNVITGSPKRFTGSVRVQSLFDPTEPSRTSGGAVTFPAGSAFGLAYPSSRPDPDRDGGCWLVQQWGGPVQVIHKGDVVWIPPGVKHWHGATPTSAMTHIAVQESLNGVAVNWLEQVANEQYQLNR